MLEAQIKMNVGSKKPGWNYWRGPKKERKKQVILYSLWDNMHANIFLVSGNSFSLIHLNSLVEAKAEVEMDHVSWHQLVWGKSVPTRWNIIFSANKAKKGYTRQYISSCKQYICLCSLRLLTSWSMQSKKVSAPVLPVRFLCLITALERWKKYFVKHVIVPYL